VSSTTTGSYNDSSIIHRNTSLTPFQNKKSTFKLIKCIGYGGYGRVYDSIRLEDGLPVVIKIIPKINIVNWSDRLVTSDSNQNQKSSKFIPFEIECLIRLKNIPGVVNMIDFFQEASCFVIIMEKLRRCITLFDLVNGKPFSLTQKNLKKIFTQLIEINQWIFSFNIVHRDIKPENILVNIDDYSIKIIDFGSATNFKKRDQQFKEFQGTLECMPPEWILVNNYTAEPGTIWSIGVTFYFSIFGRYPFRTKSNIVSGKFPLPYQNISNELLQFLDCCFQMDPSKRSDFKQLLNTKWLKPR
jgi:serine/threonine protein kinase